MKSSNPLDSFHSIARTLTSTVHLKVLVFGPGQSGGRLYDKRCQIRDMIKSLGHDADFCEDILKPEILTASGLNLMAAELVQVMLYDYIVCLMTSPGTIGEVHDFAREAKIATKMMICVDVAHRDGYSAHGILRIFEGAHGKLDWFKHPVDIDECHLATRILDQIRKLAEYKQILLATGGWSA